MREEHQEITAMEFSKGEMELLYDACMFYGSRLSAISQELNGCMEITVNLGSKAKEAYQMAVRIAKQMTENE